jgi:hypothetical protein
MSSDIERDEESDGYGLSEEEVKAYLAMPVLEQQQKQLDDFIEELEEDLKDTQCIPEQGFGEDSEDAFYAGEYVAIANAFFSPEMAFVVTMLAREAQDLQFASRDRTVNNVQALIYMMEMCKRNPSETLSGEYPGGGKMEQVTS